MALFAALSDAERDRLAEHLVYAPFVKGDTITRQGAVAHWLYLIISGEADVCFDTPAGRTQVSTIMAGEVFGEMGMLTGEPRHATVIARTNVECYRLDKAGFETVLRTRPDIAGELSRVLVERETSSRGARTPRRPRTARRWSTRTSSRASAASSGSAIPRRPTGLREPVSSPVSQRTSAIAAPP